ncbi:MAG: DUF1289 domain-containing protein [Rhodospirillaceae bacterium]
MSALDRLKAAPEQPMPSPCVGVCKMTADKEYCLGCARDRDEIASWSKYDALRKAAVFADLPARRLRLGFGAPVLGLSTEDMDHRMLASLSDPAGCWVMSAPGIAAEYVASSVEHASGGTRLWEYGGEVRGHQGGMRLVLDHGMRKIKVLGWQADGTAVTDPEASAERIDLCLYTSKALMSRRVGLTEIGPDIEALRPSDRISVLFDLGLGIPHLDVLVRSRDPELLKILRSHLGEQVAKDAAHPVLHAIQRFSPHRVLLSRLGRIEVWAPIPRPDGVSPEGSHTHFDPAAFATEAGNPEACPAEKGTYDPDTLVPVFQWYPAAPVPFKLSGATETDLDAAE